MCASGGVKFAFAPPHIAWSFVGFSYALDASTPSTKTTVVWREDSGGRLSDVWSCPPNPESISWRSNVSLAELSPSTTTRPVDTIS